MPLLENLEKQGNNLFKHRGIVPLIILIPGLIAVYFSKSELYLVYQTTWYKLFELACLLICLTGFFIRVIAVGYSPKGTSGRNTEKQIADTLNTTGLYSIVRHPLYLGNYLMWLGICLRTFNFWLTISVSLFYWIYYERIMFAEEQFLRNKYGDEYLQWASKTPTFIPRFSNWKKAALSISLKKILRQEKNAFLVIFLMFFLIELISEWELKNIFQSEWYWTLGLIFSMISYVVLKFLKYRTRLLNDDQ